MKHRNVAHISPAAGVFRPARWQSPGPFHSVPLSVGNHRARCFTQHGRNTAHGGDRRLSLRAATVSPMAMTSAGASTTTGRNVAGSRQPLLAFKPECSARLVNFVFLQPNLKSVRNCTARVPGATELAILQPIALRLGHVVDRLTMTLTISQGLGIPGNRVLVGRPRPGGVCVFPHGRSIEGP
jgi:hypothetical protein